MEREQPIGVFRHAVDDFGRGDAVGIFQYWIEHNAVVMIRQVFGDNAPHGTVTESFANAVVKTGPPNRILFAPGIAARHGYRSAGRLEAPFGSADEAAAGVGLVELERMQVLSPRAVRAAQIVVEEAHDGTEWVHHEAATDEVG